MFRACKTGILRVDPNDTSVDWCHHYQLLPTKESVDKIGRLLFAGSTDPASKLVGETASSVQGVLATLLRAQGRTGRYYPGKFLAKYAVFKAVLHGGLSPVEAEALKSFSSEATIHDRLLNNLRQLIDGLTDAKCSVRLLLALAAGSSVVGLNDALSDMRSQCPGVTDKLIRDCVEADEKVHVEIPYELYTALSYQGKYDLLRTCHIPDSYLHFDNLRTFYILSKFSGLPSEAVQTRCVSMQPERLSCEEQVQDMASSNLLNRMDDFDLAVLPSEIWVTILLYCDTLLFQVYTIPRVCKLWRHLHHIVLSRSLEVQTSFLRDLEGIFNVLSIPDCNFCPWNYFLNSAHAFLRYYLSCLENLQPKCEARIKELVRSSWNRIVTEVGKDGSQMTSASYVGLYVRCRKVAAVSLELHQLPGMSDGDYVGLVRSLVDQHGVIPTIPAILCGSGCERFAKMMANDGALFDRLLQDDQQLCEKLAIHLFLKKARFPPVIDVVLRERSEFHRFLTSECDSAEKYLAIVSRDPLADLDLRMLARSIIDFCLNTGPDYDPEMLQPVGEMIQKRRLDQFSKIKIVNPAEIGSVKQRLLAGHIMVVLCDHCGDYSEDDFRTIVRFLEKYGILDTESRSFVVSRFAYRLLRNPKLTLELA